MVRSMAECLCQSCRCWAAMFHRHDAQPSLFLLDAASSASWTVLSCSDQVVFADLYMQDGAHSWFMRLDKTFTTHFTVLANLVVEL